MEARTRQPARGVAATGVILMAVLMLVASTAPAFAQTEPNVAPVAVNDEYEGAQEDGRFEVSAEEGVLANDTDANAGDTLTANLESDVQNGNLVLNQNGSFVYAPKANFVGTDTFSYTVNDGNADSAPATVTITVNPVDEPEPPAPDKCTIKGTEGADVLNGTAGRDTICGMGGNDTLRGMAGNDLIYGNDGRDRLYGGSGNDVIRGGRGKDTIRGSAGKDTTRQ